MKFINVVRRLVILALALLAVVSGNAAFAATRPDNDIVTPEALGAPVLSARRAPDFLSSTAAETSLRSTIATTMSELGQGWCADIDAGGRPVFRGRIDNAYIPASTVKLLTASTVLSTFDDEDTFETKVRGDNPSSGRVNGALELVGGGDPLLFTADYAQRLDDSNDVHTPLEKLADAVVAKGVRSVSGGIVGNGSRFDDQRTIPSWDPGYIRQAQVGSLGGLMVNQGIVAADAGRTVVGDPNTHAAAVFADLLRSRGVEVGSPPPGAGSKVGNSEIASIKSQPVSAIVGQMLTESDNTTAETLLKNVAHEESDSPGTTARGVEAIREHLKSLGVDPAQVNLVDGSGLDRSDRVTCRALQQVLAAAGPDSVIAKGLARAGETGTLDVRMRNSPAQGRVQAKTGTLSGVSALAGWAKPEGDTPVSFSLLVNGPDSQISEEAQDRVAIALATLPQAPSREAYAPSQSQAR